MQCLKAKNLILPSLLPAVLSQDGQQLRNLSDTAGGCDTSACRAGMLQTASNSKNPPATSKKPEGCFFAFRTFRKINNICCNLPQKMQIMSLHIMKLCVGCSSVEELVRWIDSGTHANQAMYEKAEHIHTTRMIPQRINSHDNSTSLYWVIKGHIQCRQRLLEIRPFTDKEGINRCQLVLEPRVIMTEWKKQRAFQGWRYIRAEEAPGDLDSAAENGLPAFLYRELSELGLL